MMSPHFGIEDRGPVRFVAGPLGPHWCVRFYPHWRSYHLLPSPSFIDVPNNQKKAEEDYSDRPSTRHSPSFGGLVPTQYYPEVATTPPSPSYLNREGHGWRRGKNNTQKLYGNEKGRLEATLRVAYGYISTRETAQNIVDSLDDECLERMYREFMTADPPERTSRSISNQPPHSEKISMRGEKELEIVQGKKEDAIWI